jgi:sortase (surface protein transpeptidase)
MSDGATVAPTTVSIPSIGLDAPIVPIGLEPGTDVLAIPDIHHVGWYDLGPSPGQDGSAVLAGHVDSVGHLGVFWYLRDLVPGDAITLTYADGSVRRFVVIGRQEFAKQDLPADLFSRQGPPTLTLITCGGAFDEATGHYVDNVVVVASPVA